MDFVVETPQGLLPVEVKATPRLRPSHVEALRAFRKEYGRRCRAGLLLHTGEELTWLVEDVLAMAEGVGLEPTRPRGPPVFESETSSCRGW
ncbi:MAG: hypothetical protein QN164_07485 [Armatimonadota bacterium]|nr:hypothetical protein [Armatimonadota bacterium]